MPLIGEKEPQEDAIQHKCLMGNMNTTLNKPSPCVLPVAMPWKIVILLKFIILMRSKCAIYIKWDAEYIHLASAVDIISISRVL